MRIGLIGLACLLMVGCAQERVIDIELLQDRNGVGYEVNASEPYTGRVIGTYENGQKQFEANFVNGGQEGVESRWYENGQKMAEDTYVNGELEGVATSWYRNGQKKSERTYVNGMAEGVVTKWHENGEVEEVRCLKNGEEVSMDNCQ